MLFLINQILSTGADVPGVGLCLLTECLTGTCWLTDRDTGTKPSNRHRPAKTGRMACLAKPDVFVIVNFPVGALSVFYSTVLMRCLIFLQL